MDTMTPMLNLSWLAISLAAVIVLGVLYQRSRRLQQAQTLRIDSLQNDLRALCNAAVAVGERSNRLERQLRHLDEQQRRLDVRQDQLGHMESEERSFDQAIRLARKGASINELVDVCESGIEGGFYRDLVPFLNGEKDTFVSMYEASRVVKVLELIKKSSDEMRFIPFDE